MDTLIARLEAAAEGSRELDAEIVVALDLRADWCKGYGTEIYVDRSTIETIGQPTILVNTLGKRSPGNPPMGDYPHYTTSLDAALSLVPEDYWWSVRATTGCWAEVGPRNRFDQEGGGATPALALVIAALKARSAA